jgi:large subunit ribosomal protein L25
MQKLDLFYREKNPNQTRKSGQIPICIYSKDYNEKFSLDYKSFYSLLEEKGHGILSTIFHFKDKSEEIFAIIKEIQFHPITDKVVNVDFFRIYNDQNFIVPAKIILKNFEKAPFVLEGGIAYLPSKTVSIVCDISSIKNFVECDVGNLHKGDVIKTSDETWTKSGIHFSKKNFPLVTIIEKS